jgi:hypothetical protein
VTRPAVGVAVMIKGVIGPVDGIVAIGALPVIVVGWPLVTRLAVGQASVIKGPVAGIVAIGALSIVVAFWPLVTRLAVEVVSVNEDDIIPGIRGVASGARAGPMPQRWHMAALALLSAGMLKGVIGPVAGAVVAIGALTVVMVGWRVIAVTGPAVSVAVMIKGVIGPGGGAVVAIGALPVVMVVWRVAAVTRPAVDVASVIEGVVGPVDGVVTIGALPTKVVGRSILIVTVPAIGQLAVIHLNLAPGNRRVAV